MTLREAEEIAKNDYLNYDEEKLAAYNALREGGMCRDKSNRCITTVIAAIYDAIYMGIGAIGFAKIPWLSALLIFSAFVVSLTINSVIIKLHYTILRNNDTDNGVEKSRKAYKILLVLRFLPWVLAGILIFFVSFTQYSYDLTYLIVCIGFFGFFGILDPVNRCLYYKREIKNTRYLWANSAFGNNGI